jgi:hypothetical protein
MITKDQVETLVKKNVPEKAFVRIREGRWPLGNKDYIHIAIAANDHQIHGVTGQFPQLVQLTLTTETNELETVNWGGMGERNIRLIPNKEDPKEKFLAMASHTLTFRRPKPVDKSVLKAIESFARRWTQALKDNRDRLKYQDIVDYDSLLSE